MTSEEKIDMDNDPIRIELNWIAVHVHSFIMFMSIQ